DSAWLIELPERIDPAVNARAIEIARAIEALSPRHSPFVDSRSPVRDLRSRVPDRLPVTDVVVGYRSVMVYIDPLAPGADRIERRLRQVAESPAVSTSVHSAIVEVPVCYDGSLGPDLGDVAAFGRCTPDEVIALHLSREYRVFVVGFVPGF